MTRRRIAMVVHAIVPGDPRIRRQSDALLEEGHEVTIVCLRQPGEAPEEVDGTRRIVRLPVDRRFIGFAGHIAEYVAFTAMATWRLAQLHRRERFDLIQIATVPDFLAFAALPEKLGGVCLLLDLHEDMPEFFRDRFRHPLLRPLMPIVTGVTMAAAAVADRIVTVHEPLRRLSIARGVAPERISVVMNSADTRLFDATAHPRRPFMEDGVLRVVHHSNLQRIYGLDVAVEGLARLPSDLRWQLDVYGDGPWRPEIERAIERTGTTGRITMHGRVPMDELPRLLARADVGIVPSLPEPYLSYSLSTKLLEYATMGVPTIATDLATFRHHFDDRALCLVPGGDPDAIARAVMCLVADPSGTVAMGAEARRQAGAFGWDEQKARYLDIVHDLIDGRAS